MINLRRHADDVQHGGRGCRAEGRAEALEGVLALNTCNIYIYIYTHT